MNECLWRSFFGGCAIAIAGFTAPWPVLGAIDLIPKEAVVRDKTVFAHVINNGTHPEYVEVSLSRLLNPGVPLKEEKLEDVGNSANPALYAFPFRFSLAPGQTKTIALKPLSAVASETVYRLNVTPVISMQGERVTAATGSVVISMAFSGIVRQMPKDEHDALSVVCDTPGAARLIATGTVRYTVKNATVDGHPIDEFNVYPGVPLPLRGRVVNIPHQPTC
jgi:hypothetical protein